MSGDSKPVALVIGASRGIGRQIAMDLATKHGGYSGNTKLRFFCLQGVYDLFF